MPEIALPVGSRTSIAHPGPGFSDYCRLLRSTALSEAASGGFCAAVSNAAATSGANSGETVAFSFLPPMRVGGAT